MFANEAVKRNHGSALSGELRCRGRLVDTVPVTWTKGRWQAGSDVFQEVWFQNEADLEAHRTRTEPFRVALAIAKDYNEHPHQFQEFRGIFEVQATGERLSDISIQTKVLRRSLRERHSPMPRGPKGEKRPADVIGAAIMVGRIRHGRGGSLGGCLRYLWRRQRQKGQV